MLCACCAFCARWECSIIAWMRLALLAATRRLVRVLLVRDSVFMADIHVCKLWGVRMLCVLSSPSMQADLSAEKEARALRDTEIERTRAELAAEQEAAAAAAAAAAESLAAMRLELSATQEKLAEADATNANLIQEAGQVKQRYLEAQDSVEAEQSAVMRMKVRGLARSMHCACDGPGLTPSMHWPTRPFLIANLRPGGPRQGC